MLFDETTAREISYRAMRLLERARLDDGSTPAPEASEPTSRLERWCAVSGLGTREELRRRLEAERLDPERFARLLAADTAEGARRLAYSADWVARLEAAYEIEDETPLRVGGAAARSPLLPFLALTKPLLAAAHARIARAASATETAAPGSLDVASVTASLFEPLPAKAIAATSRTLALELHVARLEERLAGETPEARFASFVDWLGTREAARELFAEYPVLARLLVEECDRSVTIADEFLGRFAADRGQIVTEIFGGRDPGPLASVSADAGDTHRGGRSVFVASFASGRRVVYKPRGGGLDRHFAGLVAWANGTGLAPDLRVPLVLDRETHSWAEFVEALPCASQKEVQSFYERQGALLALLYVLNAVDFHYENVIASGAYPVLVDLEALFHPAFSPEQGERVPAARAASVRMMRSVVRTGLLPWRVARSPEHGGLEVGGLADVAGQLSPEAIAMWRETGTDRLTLARERRPVPGADNVPVLSGAKVSALDFGDRLVAGFDQMYQLLTARKDEVLAKGGPLAAFRDDENRLILRATRTYAILLAESKHPNLLRDALERELHFDRLWAACRPDGFWARVVLAELEDLRSGDVPLFTARPGSRSIFTASGREIPDALSEPPISESERRLAKLSEEDRAWQSQIIVTSLATLRRGTHATHTGGYGWGRELAASEPLRVAEAVGETLASRAVFGETDVTWIDLVPDAFDCWNLEAMPLDLYSGVAGALLFFTYLRAYSRSERGREMEDRSIAALRLASRESWLGSLKLGAFTGLGGAVYALTHAAEVRREPALFDLAGQFAEAVLEGARRDSEFDVVAGAAGAIVPLLTLARLAGSAETRSAAERAALACGDRLLESASESPRGLVWRRRFPRSRPSPASRTAPRASAGRSPALPEPPAPPATRAPPTAPSTTSAPYSSKTSATGPTCAKRGAPGAAR